MDSGVNQTSTFQDAMIWAFDNCPEQNFVIHRNYPGLEEDHDEENEDCWCKPVKFNLREGADLKQIEDKVMRRGKYADA